MKYSILPMLPDHWVAVREIYTEGIATENATFETEIRSPGRESESRGICTLQAGIFPENSASSALYKSCGFREVRVRHSSGALKGVWRDVQLLERHNPNLG